MKRKLLCVLFFLISIIIAVVSFLLLPEDVVVQISANGTPSNTLPKIIAVLIPFVISTIGAVLFASEGKNKQSKPVLWLVIGYAVSILTFVFNMGK